MRETSFGRLPGRIATVGADGTRPCAGEELAARRRRLRQIDQRMADELDRHAASLVDRRLERKDHQHAIRDRAHRLRAVRGATPRSAG